MTANATKRKLKRARPNRRAMPAGMVLRGRVYHADFMKDGRRVRKRLSTDFGAACDMLNELRSRADRGALELLDNRYPWDDLKKDFLAWAKQSTRSAAAYESDLAAFEKFSHVRCVSIVMPRLVDQWRQERLTEGVTPRTINRQVGTIRNMLAKGVHRFKVLANNALADVKRLPEGDPTKVRRALTADEVEAIFKHSRPEMVPVWRLYATTGMRRMELVNLLWSDVDLDDKSITIRASVAKGKRSRRVLLDDTMVAILAKLRDEAEQRPDGWDREHVFVNQIGRPHRQNLLRKFYGTCKRAGIADGKRNGSVDLHSLRVTFTTLSLEGGASPKAVQTILGHATLDMTMRVYAKATDRSMRDAVNALPFAKATAPDHVLALGGNRAANGQDLSQDSHNSAERATA
jgi:integrase